MCGDWLKMDGGVEMGGMCGGGVGMCGDSTEMCRH